MPRSSIRRLCVYMLTIVAVVGSGAVSAIQPPVLSVYAKRLNSTGALQSVEPGATLVTGDAISIRVRSAERAYVYVIAVGASGSAVMLQPFSEQPDDALMPAQMRRTIPGNGAVLPLDRHVGNETLIAVATPTPVRDPRAMLLEIESRAARGGILDAHALADFGEVAVFAFRHVPGAEILSEKQPARPVLFANSATESGVLSGAGSRIRALLDGIPPQRLAPVNVPAVPSAPPVPSASATPKDNSNIDQPARAQALNVTPAEPTQAFAPPAPVTPGAVRNPAAAPVRPAPVITRPPPPRNEISKASAETAATSTGTPRAAVARPVQAPAPRVTSQVRQAARPEPVLSESLTSAPAVAAPPSPPPAPTSGVTVAVPATSAPVVVTPPARTEAPVAQAVGGVLGALASFFAPTASEDEEATQESAANENADISSPAGDKSDAPLVVSSADEERAQTNSGATASPNGVVKDTADDGAFLSFDRIPERVVTPASTSPSVSSTTEPRRAVPPVQRLSVVSQGAPEPTPSRPVRVAPTPNKVEQPKSTVSQPLVMEPIITASTTVTPPVTPAPSAAVPRNQAPESSAAPPLAVREVTAAQAEPRDVVATQLPAPDEGGGFLAQLANIFGGSDTQAEDDNASAAKVPGTSGLSTAADAPKPAPVSVVESAPVVAVPAPQLPRVPPPLAPASDDIKVKLPQIASGPITVRTTDSSTPPAASAESPPQNSGVMSAAGSRIAALLGFGSSSDSDDEPAPTEAPSQAAETVPATDSPAIAQPLVTRESGTPEQEGSERPLPEPNSQLSDADSSNRSLAADTPDLVRAGASASADDVAASRPEPEPARVVANVAQPMVEVPAAVPSPESVVAAIPERPANSVAPARPATAPLALTPQQALVELDPTADNVASAAMMLVVTPAATGSALLVDDEGHLLTTWHLVKGFSRVTVWPKAPGQALPDTATPMLARVVRANRNSDLALLVIEGDLPDVEPLELAEEAALKRGEVVHVLGHTNGDRWTHVMARHVRRKARHSWITQGRFVHRESVLSNQAVGAPDTTGGAVFNGRMQLVGLNVQIGRKSGQLYSVAVDRIRRFLSGELATDPSPSG